MRQDLLPPGQVVAYLVLRFRTQSKAYQEQGLMTTGLTRYYRRWLYVTVALLRGATLEETR